MLDIEAVCSQSVTPAFKAETCKPTEAWVDATRVATVVECARYAMESSFKPASKQEPMKGLPVHTRAVSVS